MSKEEKVVFEKSRYDGGRYLVERGFYDIWGIRWGDGRSFGKKSSAIAKAESLLAEGKCDRVRVIDTNPEE